MLSLLAAALMLMAGGFSVSAHQPRTLASANHATQVTHTDDSGAGSLRQAILNANDQPGRQHITFAITASPDADGRQVILVESPLPAITDAVEIDGRSQPGHASDGGPVVEISGASLSPNCAGVESGSYRDSPGLDIVRIDATGTDASGTSVRGLRLSHFCEAIAVSAQVTTAQSSCPDSEQRIANITIRDNRFENNLGGNAAVDLCNTTDSAILANQFANSSDHMEITRSRQVVVARNQGTGAQDAVELIRSHDITIRDNHFGGNDRGGVVLGFGSGDSQIVNNIITGMAASGMVLGDNNIVTGNRISESGWYGIEVRGASGNVIHNNVIADNGLGGIVVYAGALLFLDGCDVETNGDPVNCSVVAPLHEGGSYGNQIANNTIRDNAGPGVLVGGVYTDSQGSIQTATGNSITDNQFSGNLGSAIDLADLSGSLFFNVAEPYLGAWGRIPIVVPDGPTPNDSGLQSNGGQNAPVLNLRSNSSANSSRVGVEGMLHGNPNTSYRVEIYTSSAATELDVAGSVFVAAGGERLIQTRIVDTDANGNVSFELTAPPGRLLPCVLTGAAGNEVVRGCLTGAATQILAGDELGSTSEFSSALVIAE
jgi:parallel beta-helix repeat protein